MWLESPSAKLKQEFLNWIAVALMDYTGEPELDEQLQPQLSGRNQSSDSLARWAERKYQGSNGYGTKEEGPIDLLLEMRSLKVAELEVGLANRRQACERAMREMDDCLRKLDELDREAEKHKHLVLEALGSQDVQKALLPAPNTDKTLVQTVESKLKDVNERIVFVTKVMVSARYDLNRLRYEIELEQRSIRLFRQYKIVIAIVTLSALLCLWYLYYQRTVAMQVFPNLQTNENNQLLDGSVVAGTGPGAPYSSSSWTGVEAEAQAEVCKDTLVAMTTTQDNRPLPSSSWTPSNPGRVIDS
ncbi:hypothetical protein DFQ27_007358 [Actinomortierella ambigua]|uniref:Uncharacterized protein n=1 Tax=Actinomortierella ambigua TaxID=1343610 RepID=A0A9P6PVD8_9FUNG|nr:hypothetical protein DFQ27_007358 [Actinomortierella ambigua]